MVWRGIIDLVLISNDLIEHIDYIHVDDARDHVLTKSLKTQNGIDCIESDHNMINTKLNIRWIPKESQILEVFNFKDLKAQKLFKSNTTNTDKLSKLEDSNKRLDLVTKKFIKILQGLVHLSFKKVRIVDKEDKQLEELYNLRRVLRTKTDEESVNKLEDVEIELSEKYSKPMYEKSMGELKGMGDSEDGGFNSGKLWKLKKKQFHQDSPSHQLLCWTLLVNS